MKRRPSRPVCFLVGAVVGLATPYFARSDEEPPRVMLATLEQDLGKVARGEAVVAKFPMQNVGGSRLIVRKASDPCYGHCDTGEPLVIEPGEVRILHLFAETSQSLGSTVFQADYTTNAPSNPRFSLKIKLAVIPERPVSDRIAMHNSTQPPKQCSVGRNANLAILLGAMEDVRLDWIRQFPERWVTHSTTLRVG